jgi:small subunit ribosomal protein S6
LKWGFAPETKGKAVFMPLYEHVFLARPDISAQQAEQLVETYKSLISENGGTIGKTEYWGLRPLSYRMKKSRKAHFTLMNIDASPAAVGEMERQMRLNEDIMRFLTLRVETHEDGPSAMMRRDSRDDRRGPRRDGDRDRRPRGPRRDDDRGGRDSGNEED